VQDVQFTVADQQAVRAQALREAALKARADADVLAAALGLKVVRIISADEPSAMAVPVREITVTSMRAMAAKTPTQIEPGTIDVSANVVLTVEVTAAAR
jgi:uncharacterized protein